MGGSWFASEGEVCVYCRFDVHVFSEYYGWGAGYCAGYGNAVHLMLGLCGAEEESVCLFLACAEHGAEHLASFPFHV